MNIGTSKSSFNIMPQKHLLSVDNNLPKPGFGASVIIYRHLKRLKDWKISIIVPEQPVRKEYNLPETWHIIMIPQQRWRWPPIHSRISALFWVRFYLMKAECERFLNEERPTAILNLLGRNSGFAYYLSKMWNVPLSILIHDRWQVWVKTELDKKFMTEKRARLILNYASRIWAASPRLADYYKVKNRKKVSLLYAVPEGNPQGFAQWRDDFKSHPVIAVSGSFHDYQVEIFKSASRALQKINGTLLIISTQNDRARFFLDNHQNIKYQNPFDDNMALIGFLKKNASCILVPGSFTEYLDWKINIPARLIEFSHLGLPIVIASPPDSYLSEWAEGHKWHGYLDTLDDGRVFELIKQITERESWLSMAEQSKNVALNEFNPEAIQKQFESELVIKNG